MTGRSSSAPGCFQMVAIMGILLIGGERQAASATSILMVGADPDPTFGGDVGTYVLLAEEYGEALDLGDDGVFYMQGALSVPEDAELVDVVFISSTLGSGTVRDKFEDTEAAVLNCEQAIMQDDQAGNFFMSTAAQTSAAHTQLDILEPDHPLAAGLDGTVDVFTEPQTLSVGLPPLAPGVIAIAQATVDANLQGIFAVEAGAELLGNGSAGMPATAAGRRVMFFMEDQGGNFLTPDGEALLLSAMDWLAEGSDPCDRAVERIDRTVEPSVHQPGETISVALAVSGVAGPAMIEETFPDHLELVDNGGGTVAGNTITFSVTADGDLAYSLKAPDGECATTVSSFSGGTAGDTPCETRTRGDEQLRCRVPGAGGTIRILMVGADAGPTFGGDAGTYAILTEEYGEALELGDEGVFYMQGSASVPEDAELVDVVFISSTLGSGDARGKFEEVSAGVLNHEQALMLGNQAGNFFMSNGAQTSVGHAQLDILEPDHPLAAGLDGTVDVFTAPQIMSVGLPPLAPGVIAIARTTVDANLQGIFAAEVGADLLGNGSAGMPATAAGRRVMFFMEDQGGNFLTAAGEALLLSAMDWLAEGPAPCDPPVERIERTLEPSVHDPGATIGVTLAVSGVAVPSTIEETFPDHLAVVDNGGGTVAGNTITFSVAADGDLTYSLKTPDGECATSSASFSGGTVGDAACETPIRGDSRLRCRIPRPGEAPRILMVGADAGPTFGGDAGVYVILTDIYGEAAELGEEGVFYMQGSASAPEDAELVDVVFISSTLGSGTVRDKFEDAETAVLNCEQALMPAAAGNFFMSITAQTSPGHTQLDILEPDHPLAAGLEDTVDVFTSPQIMSVGSAFSEVDLAPDAIVIAQTTNDPTLLGIFAIEEGGELLGDGSPGSPSEAFGRRVMFFLEDQGGNFLTGDGEALLIAAMDWLAGLEPVEPGGPEFIRGDADGNGSINISDGVFLLNFLFSGEGAEPPCKSAGDADDTGSLNLTDAVFVLNFLFGGQADPPPPHPGCGDDPTADDLGCETPLASCAGG